MTTARLVLEFAGTVELLALRASGEIRVTLDLLLAACQTGNSKSLARFASLCDTPMWVHRISIDDGFAMAVIVIKVAQAFSRHVCRSDKLGKELISSPDSRSHAFFKSWGRNFSRNDRSIRGLVGLVRLMRFLAAVCCHRSLMLWLSGFESSMAG